MKRLTVVTALALVAAVAALAPSLRVQREPPYLPVGTRVRVTESYGVAPFTGSVLRLTRDTLSVSAGSGNVLVKIAAPRLLMLGVSEGRERFGWGERGATIGGIGGGLMGGVVQGMQNPGTLAGIAGLFAGGILGAAAGGVTGAVMAPERWRQIFAGAR